MHLRMEDIVDLFKIRPDLLPAPARESLLIFDRGFNKGDPSFFCHIPPFLDGGKELCLPVGSRYHGQQCRQNADLCLFRCESVSVKIRSLTVFQKHRNASVRLLCTLPHKGFAQALPDCPFQCGNILRRPKDQHRVSVRLPGEREPVDLIGLHHAAADGGSDQGGFISCRSF